VSTVEHPDASRAPRAVRSFVRREGRMTSSQRRALDELAPRYRWPLAAIAPREVTGRAAPLWLEIGCGDGENVLAAALAEPARDYIACEVHGPGVGHLLNRAEAAGLSNLWVAQCDVLDLLRCLPDGALTGVNVFFPDPWPKKRHHKRRLLQAPLLDALARVLAREGRVFVATDWADYAEGISDLVAASPGWLNLAGPRRHAPRLKHRILTKFERKALREGRTVADFVLART
jgi:tRNA (guanine-N7-)-methyltransferase